MQSNRIRDLSRSLSTSIPSSRLIDDPLRRLVYGRDASFYSLIPQLVVKVDDEDEVVALVRHAGASGIPLTFRAAGTSLSGQSVSDSVLCVIGPTWTRHRILDGGARISLQPGVIGARANMLLAPYGRKIGPDPASINAAMIGGIAANNASGMCCGTAQNSYRTLSSMRIIFADGTRLDTGDRSSKEEFSHTHASMIGQISDLAGRARSNKALADRIRRKYSIKNTTGYSLNALVDFQDPIDIIAHLMIGSEGTLGFISEITYHTVPELPYKATALMLFRDISSACGTVMTLKSQPVDAVELMDRASLRSVEGKKGMPAYLAELGSEVAALLVETRAADSGVLREQIASIGSSLPGNPLDRPLVFTEDPGEYSRLWDIRKGLFPSVGAMRRSGTTVIIEDVAFPVTRLGEATRDLRNLFHRHGYDEAIIFGHALEGNLHFVFAQDFNEPSEVERYAAFLDGLTSMVVGAYDGSLKAEHGTGRNMAPFVELEWGREAYQLMQEIKQIFDPGNILNPGVILNPDRRIHVRNLKPLPEADPIVDKCIECGFCEVHCPSRQLTLTPRQRIAAYREIVRRRGKDIDGVSSGILEAAFEYDGDETCATDGLCATSCPVAIDTGQLIKHLRAQRHGRSSRFVAGLLARNMSLVTSVMRISLNAVHGAHRVLGTRIMSAAAQSMRRISGNHIPLWNRWMPRGASGITMTRKPSAAGDRVVYVPSCINRSMGPPASTSFPASLTATIDKLLRRTGYDIVYPEDLSSLCCGMAFASKGFVAEGDAKLQEMERAVLDASDDGNLPVLMDMSPCLLRMKEGMSPSLRLFEPVEFSREFLIHRLDVKRIPGPIAVHSTCSARKMGLESSLIDLARSCAEEVIVPDGIECCGWAGDRGFTVPELNASALTGLKEQIPPACRHGYSTSRTCEIGLSLHSGIEYGSILYLLEKCSRKSDEA